MSGKCIKCGKDTDNFFEYSDWWKRTFPTSAEGYWKCPECMNYDIALSEWRNERYGTREITCPWCGYEFTDSWECDDSDDTAECPDCGKLFEYTRNVEVSYTSKRRECDFGFGVVSVK